MKGRKRKLPATENEIVRSAIGRVLREKLPAEGQSDEFLQHLVEHFEEEEKEETDK